MSEKVHGQQSYLVIVILMSVKWTSRPAPHESNNYSSDFAHGNERLRKEICLPVLQRFNHHSQICGRLQQYPRLLFEVGNFCKLAVQQVSSDVSQGRIPAPKSGWKYGNSMPQPSKESTSQQCCRKPDTIFLLKLCLPVKTNQNFSCMSDKCAPGRGERKCHC